MDIGAYGDVYAVTNQYLPVKGLKTSELKKQIQEHGLPHDFAMSTVSDYENRLAVPGAVIKVNPLNGEREEFLVSETAQLRSQSVAAHNPSKRVFATYVYSNKLIVIDEEKKAVSAVNAFDYGIQKLRGVSAIPNSDFIAIADQERGIVIVNAKTLKEERKIDAQLFLAPHIFAA